MLLINLDIHGICVSGGSACSSGADEQSHVIQALDPAGDSIPVRFSFSRENTTGELDRVVETLSTLL
jgi:cysteine desulfurase